MPGVAVVAKRPAAAGPLPGGGWQERPLRWPLQLARKKGDPSGKANKTATHDSERPKKAPVETNLE